MVTDTEVYNTEMRDFCRLFGFDFQRHLLIKQVDKEVVIMHGILSTNSFYNIILKKFGSFDLRNKKIVNQIRKKAEHYMKKTNGGSGNLNWQQDRHEIISRVLQLLTEKQAIDILWYPDFIDKTQLKEAMPSELRSYIPEFVDILKFIAFVKFIYPEWIDLIKKCRTVCLEHEKLNAENAKYLPWHWSGKLTKDQHAASIHESIHNILHNSGVDTVFKHNAYREGVDVFFHRKSRLFLGYYQANRFWSGGPKHYWAASKVFWKAFEHITDKNKFSSIPKILKDSKNPITAKIMQQIKERFNSDHFHD